MVVLAGNPAKSMKMKSGKSKLKSLALVTSAVLTFCSLTFVNYQKPIKTEAQTIQDLEDQKAKNEKEIAELEKQLEGLKDDIAEQKQYQEQLQEKIDLQNENISNVNTIINDLNNKINEKNKKISQLESDIAAKQKDIEEGLELFKARLRAMYISGNDSLASALVGATDFYDMLSKIELISQVAKHDDELIDSLKTQLQQYKEAQAQLDVEKTALAEDLDTQQEYRQELTEYYEQLQADYEESSDYIDRREADINAKSSDIGTLKDDNAAMDAEIDYINSITSSSNETSDDDNYEDNYSDDDNSVDDDDDDNYNNDDYSEDGSGDGSGDGEIGGSSGGGGGSLSWPVPGFYTTSSGYGYRWGSLHAGIDIAGGGIAGATVTAANSGTVILVKTGCPHNYGKDSSCGCNGGYGNYVVIDHGNGLSTAYCHMQSVYVSVGQSVSAGEAVGAVGSTGWSTGFHLHFEVRVNGSTVDPVGYLY